MIKAIICVCVVALLAHQGDAATATSLFEKFAETGNCQFYDLMENKFHCGTSGYLIGYGKKYCNRFGVYFNDFTEEGQTWVQSVRSCLMYSLIEIGSQTSDCKTIKKKAFDSHVKCYLNPSEESLGFCDIYRDNLGALWDTYKLKDFFSIDAIKQVYQVMKDCWFGRSEPPSELELDEEEETYISNFANTN